jgi:hypothetical protein
MNILVNGTCLSRGPGTWPYHLQSLLGTDMTNLSLAGAGSMYIFESTLRELCRRHYDLVILTWTNSHHVSIRIDDISQFSDSQNTSLYQSAANDWPEKIVEPINDQDYVEKNWIINAGYMNGVKDSVSRFFEYYQTYVKFPQSLELDLTHIISMQSFLKVKGIPYLFLYANPTKQYQRFDYLYNQIDWSKWYLNHTLKSIAQLEDGRYASKDDDGMWVSKEGHKVFADFLYDFITANIIDLRNRASIAVQ